MKCSNCDSENSDTAKFCKKCGAPLKANSIDHGEMIKSMGGNKSENNTTKYLIIALAVVAVVLAGAFIYLYAFGDSGTSDTTSNSAPASQNQQQVQATPSSSSQASPSTPSSISILGGSFSTGSAESDKTYARINVGTAHAGENVIVQIFYSRDGNSLNNGNMVPATVHSDGYLEIASADAYHYYPDFATINIYDTNSKLLTTQSVALSPTSGTQTF